MELEKIIGKILQSEYGQTGETTSFEIVKEQRQAASQIVEVKISCQSSKDITVFVKRLYGHQKTGSFAKNQSVICKEYEILKKIYEKTKSFQKISVVKPLAVFPELLVLVTLSAGNDTALDIFKNGISRKGGKDALSKAINVAINCGNFLKMLQSMNWEAPVKMDQTTISKRVINLIRTIPPISNRLHKKMYTSLHFFIDSNLSNLGRILVLSRYHGDYNPQNVIVQGEKIVVLDFCDSDIGSIYIDVARFYQMLDNYAHDPRYSFLKLEKLKSAFLKNFDPVDKILLTSFRLEILLEGIKERLRLRVNYGNRITPSFLLNEWYLRRRINRVCQVCYGKDRAIYY